MNSSEIAQIVAKVADYSTRCHMARDFAVAFLAKNPNFYPASFYRKCGIGQRNGNVVLTKEGTR